MEEDGISSWQKTIAAFTTLFLFLLGAYAQTSLDFQNFTQKDGLASDYVLMIYQDHLGYMWIGTESGLDRFDGQHFLHFKHDPEDPQTLDDNWVQSLFEDSQHNLWIGTEKGLNRLNRTTGKIERIPMYKSGQKIQSVPENLCEDPDGNLWMNIVGEGVFQLKQRTGEENEWYVEYLAVEDSLPEKYDPWRANRLLFATTEDLWFSNNYAIKRFHLPTKQLSFFYPPDSDDTEENNLKIVKTTYVGDGSILVCTHKNLFVLDTETDAPQLKLLKSIGFKTIEDRSNFIHINFLKDGKDVLFVSIYRDLFFFNTQNGRLESIRPQDQTSNRSFPNFIRSPFKDRQGNYWIGTEGSGVYLSRKVDSPFTLYQHDPADPNSLSPGQVRTFVEDGQGHLWVGILNHGIDQFTYNENNLLQKKKSIVPLLNPSDALPTGRMVKIIQGPEEALWIASLTHGVIKMDLDGPQFTIYDCQAGDSTSLRANRVWALTVAANGHIWAGTWEDGLSCIDPQTGAIERLLHDPNNSNSLVSDKIRYLYTDPEGILWIGTDRGLSRFDSESGQFTNFRHDPNDPNSLSDNLIWAIYTDRQGVLWVGTNTGLNRYDQTTGQFERFYEKDGLPNNTIYGLLEDDEGTLWVSTESGLARRLSGDSELAFFPLGMADGLKTISFVPKAVLNSSRSEQLFFGSTQGILTVKPSLLQLSTPTPEITLHALSKFNPYSQGGVTVTDYFINNEEEPIKLEYRDQMITFTLSDLNWKDNRGLRYDYQLVGFNQQWMSLAEDMQIAYTSLHPGRYQLLVRARNAENIPSEVTELINIRVYPPWWQSWWAYLGYVIFVGTIILAIYRFQVRRQLEKQETTNLKALDAFKSRLYTNITHEFRSPLTVISGMLDLIEKTPEKWLKRAPKIIRKNNTILLDLINQMLELQKVESGKLKVKHQLGDIIPFLHSLFEQFQALAQSKEQQMEFICEVDSLLMDFDSKKILRIVSNLLSNAINYTPKKGDILFQVSSGSKKELTPDHCLILEVTDTGPGIPEDQLPYIFNRFYQANVNTSGSGTGIGLSLIQELVKLLKGQIEVSSRAGQGTTFQVFLPITQNAAPQMAEMQPKIQSTIAGIRKTNKELPSSAGDLPIALIVEDNHEIAQYLKICLGGSYQLEMAVHGQEGIDKAFEKVPDVIISDVMMPQKNGFELCEALKEDIRTSHIPIILLTAKSDVESRIQGLKHGADDYLAKPFNEEELRVRMQNLLAIRRKLQLRYQNVYERPLPKAKIAVPHLEDEFILKIKELFEEQMMDPAFDLDKLCQALNLSRSNLYRKIKALTGRSPAVFLRSLRLQKARQILLSSDLPVKQVAYDVGFSDPSYFSRSYTEEFGESPNTTKVS